VRTSPVEPSRATDDLQQNLRDIRNLLSRIADAASGSIRSRYSAIEQTLMEVGVEPALAVDIEECVRARLSCRGVVRIGKPRTLGEWKLEELQKWLTDVQSTELERLEYVSSDGQEVNLLKFIPDHEESWPSQTVERSELERILALAIDRMPKNERVVLSLYYYEELSLREISQIMGMHLSRIGQLRVQAVLRLRSHLERVWLSKPGKSK